MVGTEKGHELRTYIAMVRRWLWFLLLCTILAAGGTYVGSKLQTPIYRATTLLIVGQQAAGQDPYSSLLASDQLVTTYNNLITQQAVLQKAADQLGNISAKDLTGRIQSAAQTGTQIIQLQADDPNPSRAANLANAVANAFISVLQDNAQAEFDHAVQQIDQELNQANTQINNLTTEIGNLQAANPKDPAIAALQQQLTTAISHRTSLQTASSQISIQSFSTNNSVRVFQPALPPSSPDHPKTLTNTILGAVLGLVLAFCFVFLREFLDDRVHTAEEVENVTGLVTLGTIPRQSGKSLTLPEKGNVSLADNFRIVRTNLSFVSIGKPLHSILVTSPGVGEGKTTTAINLAISLAIGGKHVLLIDADLRQPSIHKRMNLENTRGLTLTLLDNEQKIIAASIPNLPNLTVLTAGPKAPNPTELLASDRMRLLIESITKPENGAPPIDVIVIDSPPALGFADAAVLASYADATLIVAHAHLSHASALVKTKEALKRVNAHLIGVLFNGIKKRGLDYYYS